MFNLSAFGHQWVLHVPPPAVCLSAPPVNGHAVASLLFSDRTCDKLSSLDLVPEREPFRRRVFTARAFLQGAAAWTSVAAGNRHHVAKDSHPFSACSLY